MADRDTNEHTDNDPTNTPSLTAKWRVRLTIALVFGLGFFIMLGLLVFIEIPQGNREVLITLLGGLGGSVTTIIAFYFGDSETNQPAR